MLQFVKRGAAQRAEPIDGLSPLMSEILRNRGVDTPEKAEQFLHPSLSQLHDPLRMQGMERAVRIIRRAAEAHTAVVVYGDYDVDGVCATSILLETLRALGLRADFRIPSRHGEGYGLNCDAVREIAAEHRLLITVDCGVTNHEEVRLAQSLGMTVIVTDHHQLADTPSPADVTLNPLLGDYPFRRLCGAGVAFKLSQALLGLEAAARFLPLAALATVADIVPLIDENRVIVREGLAAMGDDRWPGLTALMRFSGVTPPVSAGQVAFRLAPRLNAGGRLEDASQGVTLLTTRDAELAERIAAHLEEENRLRQGIEQEITENAVAAIPTVVDFRDDRVIIVEGEDWNNGVIGLAAGRICERYHFPTIVLSRQGEEAVGSCRSIPGVNIHAMLSTCKDLFVRFGGHEQAAGLTMRAALIPELRRRLNLAIREKCDERCFIPAREYDLSVPLSAVTLEMIDSLAALQPTGYGNPAPVLLTRGAQVQQARRIGKTRQHLKLSLLEGGALRDGVGFSQGDWVDEACEMVDVLYAPERNEYLGRVSAQLQVQALRPAEGTVALPGTDGLFRGLLQEMTTLAAKFSGIRQTLPTVTPAVVHRMMQGGRGVLAICHERERAAAILSDGLSDAATGWVKEPRAFNTVLCAPDLSRLTDCWREIVLVDGDLLPGEVELIRARCPRAALSAMKPNPALASLLRDVALPDEPLRTLYRRLRQGGSTAPEALSQDTGLTAQQVLVGLTAFREVGLAEFTLAPYTVRLLPPVKCRMEDSPLIRYLRAMM